MRAVLRETGNAIDCRSCRPVVISKEERRSCKGREWQRGSKICIVIEKRITYMPIVTRIVTVCRNVSVMHGRRYEIVIGDV